MTDILYKVYRFYVDGFRSMTVGRVLWTVILIKLVVIFLVLKLFFFPDVLKQKAADGDRAGYVDGTAKCINMRDADGSTYYTFEYEFDKAMAERGYFTVDKGSVTVNGVSLTVCNPTANSFTVAIIPYTHDNTNFCNISVGTTVNIEFDILGKYIARLQQLK